MEYRPPTNRPTPIFNSANFEKKVAKPNYTLTTKKG